MPLPSRQTVRAGLFLLFVLTLVCLPFAVFGEEFVLPLLKTREQQVGALTVIAVALLAQRWVQPHAAVKVADVGVGQVRCVYRGHVWAKQTNVVKHLRWRHACCRNTRSVFSRLFGNM